MKSFKKVLKNKLFYLVLLLGVFFIPILKFNLQAQEEPLPVYSGNNLAIPDLEGKEYLGDGVYRLYDANGVTTDYNVYNGIYIINGTWNADTGRSIRLDLLNVNGLTLTVSVEVISGIIPDGMRYIPSINESKKIYNFEGISYEVPYDSNIDAIRMVNGAEFDDFQYIVQAEKGSTATPYTVPLQPYLWHEKQLSYESGYHDGFDDGFDDGVQIGYQDGEDYGYYLGYNTARDEYGIFINDEWVKAVDYGELQYNEARDEYGIFINDEWLSATDYGGIQYNAARDEYGILINGEWVSAVDYGDIQYTDGYQDGEDYGYYLGYNTARDEYGIFINDEWVKAVDYGENKYSDGYDDGYDLGYQDCLYDTHEYYNDNGLFIPKLTPKGHLVIDFDLRYGEPYFYLQDFSGRYDPDYFGFQHNRWLEKAFEWAYDAESDFLAINDLYAIKYQSDEVLYKYFFYKYDNDSIYFYNDNGTLLKVVERADFKYYIYEVPELTQEEQARIDNAYNKGKRDYGYYDSENEEYLTATEYGEIQYNLGVQSTSDKAYSDGFVVAMWYSHQRGYDWLHATYYELIAERPILYNVHDVTSYAFQEGHNDGFNKGRDVGYDLGYDDGKNDGIDIGYDDGYIDGEEDGYDLGYQKAVDNTYDTIYDDIYNIGYKDGQKVGMNNKFYSGLEKWIVPAIIVVLFFGLLMLFPKNKED